MVCVVNLVSPDGRFDATYLDNYAQIYVLDVLKRISGVSDVTTFGRKYAMRVWLDPDRMAAQLISPAEVVQAIQAENRQAAAGKIGGQPAPPGLVFEYPILTKGRLTTIEEFGDIIVRRRDDGSIVRLHDVGRVALDSENYETAGWLSGKPAGALPVYQYSDANALKIVEQVRASMERLKKSFPEGLDYKIVYDTTRYVSENIEEVQHTLLEAFVLVLLVVFVFLQGVRATIIPMLAIPVSLVATFAMMAAFGFSINTLTLCGLILAIGLVVDDAIIVVENVEKYLERGEQPTRAVKAAMREITAPILTISLVLSAVFVPVAFIPGLTGRLYNQFAMTIVFSFVFSAVNSLTFSPAMSRLFLRPRHGESSFILFRWFNRGMRWLETSYDAFLEFTAHHWWTIVVPSLALLALTGIMLAGRPKAFIPTEDQGYLIIAVQTPDGTGRGLTSKIAQEVSKVALDAEGVSDTVLLDGFNVLSSTNQANSATCFVVLDEWSKRKRPELRAQALVGRLQEAMRSKIRGAVALVIQPPPIRGLSQTGGFEYMIEDRDGKGVEALAMVTDRFIDAARKRPELAGVFTPFSARVPQLRFLLDRTKRSGSTWPSPTSSTPSRPTSAACTSTTSTCTERSGRSTSRPRRPAAPSPTTSAASTSSTTRGRRSPSAALGDVTHTLAPIDVPHYNLYAAAKITGQPASGYSSGQAIHAMEEVAAGDAARGLHGRVDRHHFPGAAHGQPGVRDLRPVDRLRLPLHGRALRELDPPAGDHPHRPAGDVRRHDRPVDLRHAAGRLRPDRPGDADRARDQERHPDRRVWRRTPAQAWDGDHRVGQGGVAPAAAADPDDVARLRDGRAADGPCHGRRGL